MNAQPHHRRLREWAPVWAWAAVVAGLLLVPYALRYRAAKPGWWYTGIMAGPGQDTASHLTFARQARDGWFLFELKCAGADPRGHRFFNLLFLTMGLAARWLGLSILAIFAVERTVMAILVLVATYWFAGLFFADRRMRWTSLVLVTTSAGLQWLSVFGGGLDAVLDESVIESSTIWTLQWEVVVPAATGLLVLTLGLAHRALAGGGRWQGHLPCQGCRRGLWLSVVSGPARVQYRGAAVVAVGLATLAQAAVHPHDVFTAHAVVAALVAVTVLTADRARRGDVLRRGLKVLGTMFAFSAPLMAYHSWVILSDPSYAVYAKHTHPFGTWEWPRRYGLVLVMAVVGAGAVIRRRERGRALLVVWPALMALVMATPFPRTQRLHLHFGLHIVFCILAVRGLWALGRWPKKKGVRPLCLSSLGGTGAAALAAFVFVASITNLLHWSVYWRDVPMASPGYLPVEEREALDWMDRHLDEHDVIACVYLAGTRVPLFTGSRVYVGDKDLTPDFANRKRWMAWLMGTEGPLEPPAIAAILARAKADYVYVENLARHSMDAEPVERTLVRTGLADRVFANRGAAVYRVNRDRVRAMAAPPPPRSQPARLSSRPGPL